MAGWSSAAAGGGGGGGGAKDGKEVTVNSNKENRERNEERLSGAKQDLFELLERVQCSRIDDQRCELPSKLSQVRIR